ncbi:MAG TPA: AI-2E family transporter [Candidatus Nanoarchaeia archaeon]|nr:AI-2E family transporter [Candidatus Nanoarchaeia archaeon]
MTSLSTKFIFGLLLLALIGLVMYYYSFISFNIIVSFVCFLIIAELLERLEHKGFGQAHAYTLLILGGLVLLLVLLLFVSIPVYQQTRQFISQGPEIFARFQNELSPLHDRLPFTKTTTALALEHMQSALLVFLRDLFSSSSDLIVSLLMIPLLTIVLLASRKTLKESLMSLIPNNYFEVSVTLAREITDHIQTYVFAKAAETGALIIFFLIGFLIIGLPNAFLFAVLSGLLNIIPFVGMLLNIPLLALAAASGGGVTLFILSVVILILAHLFDNAILTPLLVAKIVDVHPFIVVVVTLVGGEIIGFIGFIIAIPAYVIAKTILVGLYEYLKAVQRHETLLAHEKNYEQQNTQG